MGGHIHLAVPDLFLARELASEGYRGLQLRALETFLARAHAHALRAGSLEAWLCEAFGAGDGAVAPVTLRADGGQPGSAYWLRADPVHLVLRGSQVILYPLPALGAQEAEQLCEALNRQFAHDGLRFFAPHPQRWYLRLERAPGIETCPLAQAAGRDIRNCLPQGPEALAWHKVLNEIQMVMHGHPVNDAREARGEAAANSVWLWGGGYGRELAPPPFSAMYADSGLANAFARAAGIAVHALAEGVRASEEGATLVIWDGLSRAALQGDLDAWRESLKALEQDCLGPMLAALRRGKLERLTLDAVQEGGAWRFTLTPRGAWRFWRLRRRLGRYAAALR